MNVITKTMVHVIRLYAQNVIQYKNNSKYWIKTDQFFANFSGLLTT